MNVYFNTPGPIPIEALTTFGVSVKETANPIGRFGTGFKYALAVILRSGGAVTVVSEGQLYRFATVEKEIRGRSFSFITMNDEPLAITTELGKDWEMWQAYRELHSNMLDEGGSAETAPRGENFVEVRSEAFYNEFLKRDKIFLSSEPLAETSTFSIHPGRTNYIFYRGVRAGEVKQTTRFTYNILAPLDLTEDRTIKHGYIIEYYLNLGLMQLEDEKLILEIIDSRNVYEREQLSYNNPSPAFIAAVKSGLTAGRGIAMRACDAAVKHMPKKIQEVELDTYDQERLDECCAKLAAMGYPIKDYPIRISRTMFGEAWGRANEGDIWLAVELFNRGDHEIMMTLLEEWMHLKYNYEDGSRAMMDWAFGQIIAQGVRRIK